MTFAQPFRDYEILDRVGAGAMGTVFKARHAKLSRIVAIKVLRPSLARDTRYVERLRREARIVAALNHPNIVTGYDLGEEGGYHYFVMEFVEGRSLRALLDPENLAFIVAWAAVGAVFAGLIYAVSVISIPMILHRQTDAITAGLTSLRLVLTQTGVMLWWGFLIAALVTLALLPWFAGLLVVGPVVGHASWHAYREAVAD